MNLFDLFKAGLPWNIFGYLLMFLTAITLPWQVTLLVIVSYQCGGSAWMSIAEKTKLFNVFPK